MMDMLIAMFWMGGAIVLSIFVFQVGFGLLMAVLGGVALGVASVVDYFTGGK